MPIILTKPTFIRQKKMNSCWFACIKMLLECHENNRSISNSQVSNLASWTKPRSFSEIPVSFLINRNLEVRDFGFNNIYDVEIALAISGPFVAVGNFGKLIIGPRFGGHALLVYGVYRSGHILHHDPGLGSSKTMKGDTFIEKQFGCSLHYKRSLARVGVPSKN